MKDRNSCSIVKAVSMAFMLSAMVLCFPPFLWGIDGPTVSTQIDPLDNWHIRQTDQDINGIAYGNGVFVTVGDFSTILISPDGINFTLIYGAKTYPWASPWPPNLLAITYNNDLFVAVGESGIILTSMDGITWAERNSGVSCDLTEVTYGNGLFMAFGCQGNIITSPDGISWSQRDTGGYTLSGIAYGNGVFVAVSNSFEIRPISEYTICCSLYEPEPPFGHWSCSKGIILTSYDGMSWIENNSSTNCLFREITFADGMFVAVGNGPILTSSDGITWIQSDSVYSLNSVTYLNGAFFAVGNHGVLTSPDGINWTSRNLETPLSGIAYGNDTFVAVEGEYGRIFTSTDGENWINGTLGRGTEVSYLNGLFMAVDQGYIMTSPDGVIWPSLDLGVSGSLSDITYGNNLYIAVGSELIDSYSSASYTLILSSSDGVKWEKNNFKYFGYINKVTYGNGTFVAVGREEKGNEYTGIILTSPDGLNWTRSFSTASSLFSGLTYGNGTFVAGGETIVTSKDGFNWTTLNILQTVGRLNSVTYGNGLFIAVAGHFILTSSDGINWTIINPGDYWDLRQIAYGNGNFVALGNRYIISSTDGINWMMRTRTYGNILGITYGNGTFLAVGDEITQSDPISSSKYILTVIKPGKGNGTITSSPPGIDCSSDCTDMYNAGSIVTLVATPSAGSIFTGWSGGCSGIDTTCTITITNGPNFVMANFSTAIPEAVPTPNTPSGPTNGITGRSHSFSTGGASSNMGHSIQYRFNWGDGTKSGWLPVGTTSASKFWTSTGNYLVKAQARCATHTSVVSDWSSSLNVMVGVHLGIVDFDGDGKTDIGVWRPENGLWTIIRSSDRTTTYTTYGALNDIPVPGDYDGDGKTDIAVWRPSNGFWFITNSSDGSHTFTQLGDPNDIPISQ